MEIYEIVDSESLVGVLKRHDFEAETDVACLSWGLDERGWFFLCKRCDYGVE